MVNRKILPRNRIRHLALAAVAALSALAAIAPGAANAGTWHMYNCHVLGHETGTSGPWVYTAAVGVPGTTLYSGCGGTGGPDGYTFGPYASGYLGASSRSDLTLAKNNPNVSITGTNLWFRVNTAIAPASGTGAITATLSKDGVMGAQWSGGMTTNYMAIPYGALATVNTVTFSLACTGSALGCQPATAFPIQIQGVDTELEENIKPVVAIDGGTLVAGGAQSATKTVTVQGTDPDSGVQKLEVLLDGQVIAGVDYDRDWTKPLAEQKAGTCAYDNWNGCPTSQAASLSVNTKLLEDGTYALTARAIDAAGNARTSAPQSVTIDNVPNPTELIPGASGSSGPGAAISAGGGTGPTTSVSTRNGLNGSPQATLHGRLVGYTSRAIRA